MLPLLVPRLLSKARERTTATAVEKKRRRLERKLQTPWRKRRREREVLVHWRRLGTRQPWRHRPRRQRRRRRRRRQEKKPAKIRSAVEVIVMMMIRSRWMLRRQSSLRLEAEVGVVMMVKVMLREAPVVALASHRGRARLMMVEVRPRIREKGHTGGVRLVPQ